MAFRSTGTQKISRRELLNKAERRRISYHLASGGVRYIQENLNYNWSIKLSKFLLDISNLTWTLPNFTLENKVSKLFLRYWLKGSFWTVLFSKASLILIKPKILSSVKVWMEEWEQSILCKEWVFASKFPEGLGIRLKIPEEGLGVKRQKSFQNNLMMTIICSRWIM